MLKEFINTVSPLNPETWETIEQLFRPKTLLKNEYFLKEGKFAKHIAFLQNGVMRGFYTNFKDIEYNKHFFTDCTLVGGYSSLITNQKSYISIQALTDCQIWVADYQKLTSLYSKFNDLERLSRIIAEQTFISIEQKELEIVSFEATKRYENFKKKYPTLEQLIPQYHIASYLGISQTQLSRIRKKLSLN